MRRLALLSAAVLTLAAAPAAGQQPPPDPLAPMGVRPLPPPPPVKPVTETLYGTPVTDNYRYMEAMGPETLASLRAQGAYTRAVLDAIESLAGVKAQVNAFALSYVPIRNYSIFGGRTFFEERTPSVNAEHKAVSASFDLMVRDRDGGMRKLVDIAALRAAQGGARLDIKYVLPSPDGAKVAVGISQGGSEATDLYVYDAATGARVAGPVDRAQFPPTSWSLDSTTLYVMRLKALQPGDPGAEKFRDIVLEAWNLTSPPTPLFGATTGHGPKFGANEVPVLGISPGVSVAMLVSGNGVQPEIKAWLAPVAAAGSPDARWTPFLDRDDGVTGGDARGDQLFLLSHKNAPTFQVLQVRAGDPLSSARVLAPARPDRVIETVQAAADALYVVTREGVYSHLLRIPAGSDRIEELALPEHGHIGETFADAREPGLAVQMSSWVSPPTEYRFDPATRVFTDLRLGAKGGVRAADFTVLDLQARARDGVSVPLSLIQPRGASGPQVTVVEAYGAYGISQLADFSERRAVFVREGISYGVCNVRGGGEMGEAWRLGGKDADKPNTWRDLIACGEDLIARGVTSRDKLFILGGSAGGIAVGRAMEERPDLFAGVIDIVPQANSTRAEFAPDGPANIPEFGTITNKAGFHNLYEMDSVIHVKPGVAYPAVLISTALNDPRVPPWEPAKFAAALQAAGGPNPVLLRIDELAGHDVDADLTADQIAFVFWRAGRPGWRPGQWTDHKFTGRASITYAYGAYEGDFLKGNKSGHGLFVWTNGDRYDGAWVDDKRSGRGAFVPAKGGRLDGQWADDKFTGHGSITYEDGGRYEGDFLNGKLSGRGVFAPAKGGRLDGEWADDRFTGHGSITYGNGNRYEGDSLNGSRSGHGLFVWANGDRYEGAWVDNKRSGRGVFMPAKGGRLDGEWTDNKFNGHGSITYGNGNRYEGDFLNGSRSGHGLFVWANGDRYEGAWVDNKRSGRGVFVPAKGGRLDGEWTDNKFNGHGSITYGNGNRYEGDFLNGSRSGHGLFVWANGNRYEGGWAANVPSGHGVKSWSDGRHYEGGWSGNRASGQGRFTDPAGGVYDGNWVNGCFREGSRRAAVREDSGSSSCP